MPWTMFMLASDVNPSGPKPNVAQSGSSGNQHFLLPLVKGHVTISAPLSTHTASWGNGEGAGGWSNRLFFSGKKNS